MKTRQAITLGLLILLAASLLSCADKERKRIEGIKENIGLEYHADLNLARQEDGTFLLNVTEIFDLAKRPSEGHQILGVRIGDKKINHKIVGAGDYEYIEEPDGIRLMLGEPQEFLSQQAGRFRIRLTRELPVEGASSGIFRKKLTFKPAELWALVEDESKTEGYTPIKMNEPDLGNVLLRTDAALGDKQPRGGRRAPDKRSLNYAIPADMAELKPLTFTYFPNRTSYYAGNAIAWVLNRLAWMVLGILLYVWWVRSREKRKKERAALKMTRKADRSETKPPPPPGDMEKRKEEPKPQKPD